MNPTLRAAHLLDIEPRTLYSLLRLRIDVFVVEQDCPYPDLDGIDLEPGTEQHWIEVGAPLVPVATLRTYVDADGTVHLGRVATYAAHRGQGYAAMLVEEALRRIGQRPVQISAQTYLEGWYARFGFWRNGDDYVEDGIPHLPMRREP